MEAEKTKVVIPRKLWTGMQSHQGASYCSPNHQGAQCCLGHVMNAILGMNWWEDAHKSFIPMPVGITHLPRVNWGKLPQWMVENHADAVVRLLARINDNHVYLGGMEMKEANIAYILNEYGFDATFVD